jgi:hypothetical protein
MARDVNSYGFPTGMNTVFSCRDCQCCSTTVVPGQLQLCSPAPFRPAGTASRSRRHARPRQRSGSAVAALSAETDRVLFKLYLRIRAPRQNRLAT